MQRGYRGRLPNPVTGYADRQLDVVASVVVLEHVCPRARLSDGIKVADLRGEIVAVSRKIRIADSEPEAAFLCPGARPIILRRTDT